MLSKNLPESCVGGTQSEYGWRQVVFTGRPKGAARAKVVAKGLILIHLYIGHAMGCGKVAAQVGQPHREQWTGMVCH